MQSKSAEAAACTVNGGVDSVAQVIVFGLVFCSGESGQNGRDESKSVRRT